jgi:hypothetical protein
MQGQAFHACFGTTAAGPGTRHSGHFSGLTKIRCLMWAKYTKQVMLIDIDMIPFQVAYGQFFYE